MFDGLVEPIEAAVGDLVARRSQGESHPGRTGETVNEDAMDYDPSVEAPTGRKY